MPSRCDPAVSSVHPLSADTKACRRDPFLQVLPVGDEEAGRLVGGSRLAPYLDAGATDRLREVLLRAGALVEEVPEVVSFWANPVIVRPDRAVAVEVAVEVAEVEREPLPPIRRVGV